jgi:hypothetical protein
VVVVLVVVVLDDVVGLVELVEEDVVVVDVVVDLVVDVVDVVDVLVVVVVVVVARVVVVVVVVLVVVVVVVVVVDVVVVVVVVVVVTTVTCAFCVYSPNHSTPSRSILHWKSYVPVVAGATTLNVNVFDAPDAIESPEARPTLPVPHIPLSWGFCEPRRYSFAVVQVFVPVFFMVIEALYVWPLTMVDGTLWLMYCASFGRAVTTWTATFGVFSPNHSTPSCTILRWKLYVPGVEGAVTVNVNVFVSESMGSI